MVYGWKSVYRRTTIQLAERPSICASRNQEVTHRSQPSATHALNIQQVGYGVRCRVTSGYDWTDICRPRGEGEWPYLPRYLAVSADASSNQTCRRSFNKTVLRHIAPATPSSCCSKRRQTSLILTSGRQTVQIWTPSTRNPKESNKTSPWFL